MSMGFLREWLAVKCVFCSTYQVIQCPRSSTSKSCSSSRTYLRGDSVSRSGLGKFQCRLCQKKQSIVKVFGRSLEAKDMRLLIGALNEQRIKRAKNETTNWTHKLQSDENTEVEGECIDDDDTYSTNNKVSSAWNADSEQRTQQFHDETEKENLQSDEDDFRTKRRRIYKDSYSSESSKPALSHLSPHPPPVLDIAPNSTFAHFQTTSLTNAHTSARNSPHKSFEGFVNSRCAQTHPHYNQLCTSARTSTPPVTVHASTLSASTVSSSSSYSSSSSSLAPAPSTITPAPFQLLTDDY